MGISTLYLGDSKLADKQVAAWAKNELEKAKLENFLIKEIYSDLKKLKSNEKIRTNRKTTARKSARRVK